MGSENEIAGDDHAHRPAGAHADGWLDAKIALDDALTGLVDGVGRAAADGAFQVAVSVCAKFGADAENGREACREEHAVPVVIGAVGQATNMTAIMMKL
ncbi:hypothetical protein HY17_15215 [Hyphomonas sp. CY54-11-8]|nr:hypothetical protein HY17_15215 [Hyphomonas sp. CY54-11-8]